MVDGKMKTTNTLKEEKRLIAATSLLNHLPTYTVIYSTQPIRGILVLTLPNSGLWSQA